MSSTRRTSRWLVGVAVPATIVVLNVGPWLIWWGDLPDPVASHFGVDGAADGNLSRGALLAGHLIVAVLSAFTLQRATRRPTETAPAIAGIVTFIGVLFGVLAVAIVSVNRGLSDWHDAVLGWGWVAGAICAAAGVAAGVAANGTALVPVRTAAAPPRQVPLAEGERAAWFGSTASWGWLVGASAELVVACVVFLVGGPVGVAVLLLGIGLVLLPFSEVHVAVTCAGIRVHSAVAWPALHLPVEQIVSARSEDIHPTAWGGWGYRGSLRLFRRSAWVIRSGPGLVLELVDDKRFAVTVDHPDEAAALINQLARGGASVGESS